MHGRMDFANMKQLSDRDEVKFVVADRKDYLYAKMIIRQYHLLKKCTLLISPDSGSQTRRQITEWCIKDNLEVRLNLQLHKIIWPNRKRGV